MFPDIAYLDWIDGRPERAEYDLGSSDLRRESPESKDGASPELAESMPAETTAKARLAAAYGVGPENVLLAAGATHANFLAAAAALAEAGARVETGADGRAEAVANAAVESGATARVLVEEPGYEPLAATPEGLGATVDRFSRPAEEGYPLDGERVGGALRDRTAAVAVTNRHNPSGRRVGRDELADIAGVVDDAGARLVVDEVYAPFRGDESGNEDGDADTDRGADTVGDAASGPFGGPTAAGLPGTVVTNSLTKFLGLGGLRLGWLVADAEFVAQARSVKRHVPAVADSSERSARRALARRSRLTADSRERVRTNRQALGAFAADREDLSGRVEPGCTYAFLEHESADGTRVAAAAWERGVLVVPGRFFGDRDRFRIAACRDLETVRAGLDRLGDVLDALGE